LLAIFGALLLPTIWDRIMSSAPPWAWNALAFAFVLVGVALLILSNPIWPRLKQAGQYPITATAVVALVLAVLGASAFWFFVLPYMAENVAASFAVFGKWE
jgi:hypothetical protein